MKTSRMVFRIIAFIALIGISNCVLIEPALAYKDDSALSRDDEAHCCLLCSSMHHQWISSGHSPFTPAILALDAIILLNLSLRIEPFPDSIFHPPLAL